MLKTSSQETRSDGGSVFCSSQCFYNHYPAQFSKELSRNWGHSYFLHGVKLPSLLCSDHTISGADRVLFIGFAVDIFSPFLLKRVSPSGAQPCM